MGEMLVQEAANPRLSVCGGGWQVWKHQFLPPQKKEFWGRQQICKSKYTFLVVSSALTDLGFPIWTIIFFYRYWYKTWFFEPM